MSSQQHKIQVQWLHHWLDDLNHLKCAAREANRKLDVSKALCKSLVRHCAEAVDARRRFELLRTQSSTQVVDNQSPLVRMYKTSIVEREKALERASAQREADFEEWGQYTQAHGDLLRLMQEAGVLYPMGRPLLTVETLREQFTKCIRPLYALTVHSLQEALDAVEPEPAQYNGLAQRGFENCTDVVDVIARLDLWGTRQRTLRYLGIECRDIDFILAFSFMRTVSCSVGLWEAIEVFGKSGVHAERWLATMGKRNDSTGHDSVLRWLSEMNEVDLDKLVLWYNKLVKNEVLDLELLHKPVTTVLQPLHVKHEKSV